MGSIVNGLASGGLGNFSQTIPNTLSGINAQSTVNWEVKYPPHNDIDTVKTHVQIAPNVYLKIIDEGGRAIFHLCENLEGLPTGEKESAGEFLPEHYKKNKKTSKWQYHNYSCNKCGVQIPNELVNKSDVIGMLAKFKTKNG